MVWPLRSCTHVLPLEIGRCCSLAVAGRTVLHRTHLLLSACGRLAAGCCRRIAAAVFRLYRCAKSVVVQCPLVRTIEYPSVTQLSPSRTVLGVPFLQSTGTGVRTHRRRTAPGRQVLPLQPLLRDLLRRLGVVRRRRRARRERRRKPESPPLAAAAAAAWFCFQAPACGCVSKPARGLFVCLRSGRPVGHVDAHPLVRAALR